MPTSAYCSTTKIVGANEVYIGFIENHFIFVKLHWDTTLSEPINYVQKENTGYLHVIVYEEWYMFGPLVWALSWTQIELAEEELRLSSEEEKCTSRDLYLNRFYLASGEAYAFDSSIEWQKVLEIPD